MVTWGHKFSKLRIKKIKAKFYIKYYHNRSKNFGPKSFGQAFRGFKGAGKNHEQNLSLESSNKISNFKNQFKKVHLRIRGLNDYFFMWLKVI